MGLVQLSKHTPAAHSPPLLLAGLSLSILTLLLLTTTATLLLFLLQRQVLIGIVVDKIVHIASFLTLKDVKRDAIIRACLHSNI